MNNRKQKIGNYYYGSIANNYNKSREYSKLWQLEQEIMKELLNKVPNNISVLDVPFGTGRFVNMYINKNMIIHGLEISPEMLNTAKKVLGDKYKKCNTKVGDATDPLPYEDNSFDLVVSFRFLKFFPYETLKKILSEFHRVTKSKCIIRIKVIKEEKPHKHNTEEYLKNLEYIGGNVYENDIIKVLKEIGFEIEKRIEYDKVKQKYPNILYNKTRKIIQLIISRSLIKTIIKKYSKYDNKWESKVYLLKKKK